MGVLTEEMKRFVDEQRLGFVATVCADGTPNLSPKGTTAVWDDDHLAFADIRSPETVANLRRNPAVEINVVDVVSRKGFRFKGTARVVEGGEMFDELRGFYRGRGLTNAFGVVVLVRVERALPLLSPAYDAGRGEDEVRAEWEGYWGSLRDKRRRNPAVIQEAKQMTDVAENFIAGARSYLTSNYLPKIERCLERLTDEDVWWRPNDESNSIGNLMLHLSGSTRMWVVSGVGGAPDFRDRQQEFDERSPIPRAELLARLRQAVRAADDVLARVDAATLLERRQIRDVNVTVLEAIFHAVEHFSMHAGQIILLAKVRAGEDLRLSSAGVGP